MGLRTRKGAKCPHCGNRNGKLIDDNGLSSKNYDYTLLCIARVPAKDVANYDEQLTAVGPDGKATCGMQWCPNVDREVG